MLNTLNLVHVFNLTHVHSFKTISTRIIFCAVEALFAILDVRHRKPSSNMNLNELQINAF